MIAAAAVHLMSAAAVKCGLAEEGRELQDLDEARKLITALAGLVTAARPDLGVHAAPLRDGLQALQRAFREASPEPDAPGEGPGREAHRPRLSAHQPPSAAAAPATPGAVGRHLGQRQVGARRTRGSTRAASAASCRRRRAAPRDDAEHRAVGALEQPGGAHRLVPQRLGEAREQVGVGVRRRRERPRSCRAVDSGAPGDRAPGRRRAPAGRRR